MRLEEQLNCIGLLGLGTGYALGKANIKPEERLDGRDGYCAKECPEAFICMAAHKTRVSILYPRATRHFERLMKDIGQVEATFAWRQMHPHTPFEPYALQLIINTEDGLEIAKSGKPKDRGGATLRWPR